MPLDFNAIKCYNIKETEILSKERIGRLYMAFRFTEESDRFFDAILSLENKDECRKFFEDICTIKEIQDMQQRLTVAQMLDAGCVYNEITEKTGASAATISRVNKCLTYGSDGYRLVLEKMKKSEKK